MAKTNAQLLQEALAVGDIEKAKELTEKLIKAGTIKKTKPKPKPTPKKPGYHPSQDRDLDESDYIAPSRPHLKEGEDYWGGKTFTDDGGNSHTYARRVSMKGTKFTNKFGKEINEYRSLPADHAKLDKVNKKHKPPVRRPESKKIKIRCFACGETVQCYPWECEKIDQKTQYRCNDCTKVR